MKSVKNRRRKNRWQVAVLVRCSIPKLGTELVELEMWAKDVNETGMKLEVSRGLNIARLTPSEDGDEKRPVRFEDIEFKKGIQIKIQDLFYDDDGSPFLNGKISWARRLPSGWLLGVQFVDTKKQSKALLGAFKDFISIVKNPLDAIEKASRKK